MAKSKIDYILCINQLTQELPWYLIWTHACMHVNTFVSKKSSHAVGIWNQSHATLQLTWRSIGSTTIVEIVNHTWCICLISLCKCHCVLFQHVSHCWTWSIDTPNASLPFPTLIKVDITKFSKHSLVFMFIWHSSLLVACEILTRNMLICIYECEICFSIIMVNPGGSKIIIKEYRSQGR